MNEVLILQLRKVINGLQHEAFFPGNDNPCTILEKTIESLEMVPIIKNGDTLRVETESDGMHIYYRNETVLILQSFAQAVQLTDLLIDEMRLAIHGQIR
jgi:hypothetical protein